MFIVKTFKTKPDGVAWRTPQLVAETGLTLGAWALTQDGVISTRTRKKGNNVTVTVNVFRDQAAYNAFVAVRDTNPEYIARITYEEANGISTEIKKFQLVA